MKYTLYASSTFPQNYDKTVIYTHAAASPENWKSDNTQSHVTLVDVLCLWSFTFQTELILEL